MRVTNEGRKLKYAMNVIQQPERARACGSGAKSSADRRPVDPPPVVELRIFEVFDDKEQEDITFSYEANFFLFATLETARPIANGRVHPAPAQIPVLTGMPVSGMAYLDRPNEAGYFIFPDLSVRHEGIYQLSFNLYEETKHPEKDGDRETASDQKKPTSPVGPGSPLDSSFDFRMEVKSQKFTVFSAKKFPGLAESTALSRTVAEQGCRVRIRRDVRMRRRDNKPSSEYDDTNAADDGYIRHGRPSEQSGEPYRERSNSASGDDGRERRLSAEFPQGYQGHSPSPVGGHHVPAGGNLNFGTQSGSQFPAPQAQFAPPPQPSFAPRPPYAPSAYQAHTQPPSQYRPAAPTAPQSGLGFDRQYPQSAYPTNPPREQRDPYEADPFRRASVGFPPQAAPNPVADPASGQPPYNRYPRPYSPLPRSINLAPIKVPLPPIDSLASPAGLLHRIAPLPSPAYERPHTRQEPLNQYPIPIPTASEPEPQRAGKRPFDSAFDSSAGHQPLYNGARPSSTHHNPPSYDDDQDAEPMTLQYKRADGTEQFRKRPIVT